MKMNEMFLAQQGKPVMMFPIRETAYDTAKYGKLDLNRKMAEEMIANFKAGALGTKPFIDKEHAEGEAAGWVQDLYLAAPTAEVASKTGATEALYASVEWNGLGQKLLADKSYQYISPWWGDFKDPADGKVHHNVFMGAALCNNPVLRMMPAIELSDRKLSEVLADTDATMEVALADLNAEPAPADPIDEMLADIVDVKGKLDGALKYKKGATRIRAVLNEFASQLKAFKASDDGNGYVLSEYDWDQCIADQMERYDDEETAQKVCGMIREKYGSDSGKKLSDVLPEVEKKLSLSPKQEKTTNGGEENMDLKEMAKILGLPDTATAEEIKAEWEKQKGSTKMADVKLTDNPEYKKLQEKVEAQNTQLADMQRKDLERQASEIVSKEITGGFKLSAPSQKIISEILLSESPTEIKLSEKDDKGAATEVTVSLADAMERLVDNLALVKMGETTTQKHDKGGSEDPEKKLSDLIAEKRKDNKDLTYRQASEQVQKENPDLAVALAG